MSAEMNQIKIKNQKFNQNSKEYESLSQDKRLKIYLVLTFKLAQWFTISAIVDSLIVESFEITLRIDDAILLSFWTLKIIDNSTLPSKASLKKNFHKILRSYFVHRSKLKSKI